MFHKTLIFFNNFFNTLFYFRLEFAPSFGYEWLGVAYNFLGFPFANERGDCLSLTPTCTTAYNSTITLSPAIQVDISSGVWSDALYDAYTQVDPLKLPSGTYWRWPETLAYLAKGHDAAVAIVLGAMEIVKMEETITGAKLAQMIRTVSGLQD